jgi:hypothetical protein
MQKMLCETTSKSYKLSKEKMWSNKTTKGKKEIKINRLNFYNYIYKNVGEIL